MTKEMIFNASEEEIEELGFDPDALLRKYNEERDRRIREDGIAQYIPSSGQFKNYAEDPYAKEKIERDALDEEVEVVVVGAGLSGWSAAVQLKMKGVKDVRVIDKAGDFGGAWYWNRYPGIRCDIESYVYIPLLEEFGFIPTEKYATGQEIFDHIRNVAHKVDLYVGALFQTEVTGARWSQGDQRWIVETDRGDTLRARFLVKTNAKLDLPKLPGIPGIERFKGRAFHTSRWDYDYTGGNSEGNLDKLHDKVVAVIGTGCTAIQVSPHLAEAAKHLYIFQRTPSSIAPRNNRPTDPEWAKQLGEGWQQERRLNFISLTSGRPVGEDLVDDSWTATIRAVGGLYTKTADAGSGQDPRRIAMINDFKQMNRIRARVEAIVNDPETAEALKPWYRQLCKRPGFSDNFLPIFNRSNVTLVDTKGAGIDEIKEHSMVARGQEYDVDCIIFATGFEVGSGWVHRSGFEIHGRDDKPLFQTWGEEGIRTLHGIFSSGFPNLFHLGTVQAGVSYSHTYVSDAQAEHIAALISNAIENEISVVEPDVREEDQWVEIVSSFGNAAVEFQKQCTPSYINNEGKPDLKSGLIATSYNGSPIDYCEILKDWRTSAMEGLKVQS